MVTHANMISLVSSIALILSKVRWPLASDDHLTSFSSLFDEWIAPKDNKPTYTGLEEPLNDLTSLNETTPKPYRLQIVIQMQHFLFSYFVT